MNKFIIEIIRLTYLTLIIIIIIIFFRHAYKPIYTIIILIIYTSLICLYIVVWTWKSLYSITIFLILIRGIFTIFIYFARLINNEQLLTNTPFIIYLSMSINFIVILILITRIFIIQHSASTKATTITHYGSKQTLHEDKIKNYLYVYPVNFNDDSEQNIQLNTVYTTETLYIPTPSSPPDLSTSIKLIYENPWWYITILCILLLILSLIITIKLCSIQNKSIRKTK